MTRPCPTVKHNFLTTLKVIIYIFSSQTNVMGIFLSLKEKDHFLLRYSIFRVSIGFSLLIQ